jgi:FAD/FMN-containing dehydrogenase
MWWHSKVFNGCDSMSRSRVRGYYFQVNIIDETKADLSSLGLFPSLLGHIGDGNSHTSIMSGDAAEKERVEQAIHKMVDIALDMEGTCTAEHSIGLSKKEALHNELGGDTVEVMRTLNAALDLLRIMNLRKICIALVRTESWPEATAAARLERSKKNG